MEKWHRKKWRKKVKKEFSMDEWSRTKNFSSSSPLPQWKVVGTAQKDELWIIVYLHTHTHSIASRLFFSHSALALMVLNGITQRVELWHFTKRFFLFVVCARVQSQEINAQFFERTLEHENQKGNFMKNQFCLDREYFINSCKNQEGSLVKEITTTLLCN